MAVAANTSGRGVGADTEVEVPVRGPVFAVSLSGVSSALPCPGSGTETTNGALAVRLAKLATTSTFFWPAGGVGRGTNPFFFSGRLYYLSIY